LAESHRAEDGDYAISEHGLFNKQITTVCKPERLRKPEAESQGKLPPGVDKWDNLIRPTAYEREGF
jgi:hypothetical protein